MRLQDCTLRSITNSNCPTNFSCGSLKDHKDLNEFLLNDAIQHQEDCIGATKLIIYKDDVAGYYTLCASEVKLKTVERPYKEDDPQTFPAIKLARFAVHKKYQSKGLGKEVVKYIVGLTIYINTQIGCRFVLVDATQESVAFYEKMGFKKNLSYKRRPSLRLDIFHDIP